MKEEEQQSDSNDKKLIRLKKEILENPEKLSEFKEMISGGRPERHSKRLSDLKEIITGEHSEGHSSFSLHHLVPETSRTSDGWKVAERVVELGNLTECDHFPDDWKSAVDFVYHRIVIPRPTWSDKLSLVPSGKFSEFHDTSAASRIVKCGCGSPDGMDIKIRGETLKERKYLRKRVVGKKYYGYVEVSAREESFRTEYYDRKIEAALATYRVVLRELPHLA